MKKILCLLCVAAVALGACSKNKKTNEIQMQDGSMISSGVSGKYQIVDQEFDNLLAPEADYDTLCAYELQACGDSYLPPAAKLQSLGKIKEAARKVDTATATKSTRAKKVVNTVNIYEVDGPNPTVPVSSKTTTKVVYKDGKVVSSTSSSSSGKAAVSTGTTTTNTDLTTF